jgi:hypothetical protein
MPRKMRNPKARFEQTSEDELFFISDGLLGAESDKKLWLYILTANQKKLRELWDQNKAAILEAWILTNPGSRPALWWDFEAPRITPESIVLLGRGATVVKLHRENYCEPRKRLSGIGTPNHEALNYGPVFAYGLPADGWITQFDESYYNARARDIHGELIPCQWKEGDFKGKAIDPDNPPVYESQSSYLKRHNLFVPGEERRLKAKDFEPEAIRFESEEGNDFSTLPEVSGLVQ